MELALILLSGVLFFVAVIITIDYKLNENDDATTIGQFKKFQNSFKGDK